MYEVTRDGSGTVVALRWPGNELHLGDTVVSNGRIFQPAGTEGVIRELFPPYVEGFTSDVILVEWQSGFLNFMKPKDLNPARR